jgi:25S rRNA (uracil2843-N3)-methyltransferase
VLRVATVAPDDAPRLHLPQPLLQQLLLTKSLPLSINFNSSPHTNMPRDKSSWQPLQRRQKAVKQNKGPIPLPTEKGYQQDNAIPTSVQQSLLNVFRDACNKGSPAEIEDILQEVKGHLFNRDFATAFGKDDYLEAYAARWSPSRALGYAQIFSDLSSEISELLDQKPLETDVTDKETPELSEQLESKLNLESNPDSSKPLNILCLGGGAGAEVVGLAGWFRHLRDDTSLSEDKPQPNISKLDLFGVDVANWDKVMQDLYQGVITPPFLSTYASAAAKAANKAVLPSEVFNVRFKQQDLLDTDAAGVNDLLANSDIVTIMFTLNELYSTSVAKTQRLLYALTASMRPGSLLLVVDSPGSYSTVTLNGASQKYPMQWLLDHTLMSPKKGAEKGTPAQWTKLVSDESRWFRVPDEDLRYPIDLENMRYQIHLYQRHDGKKQPEPEQQE